MSLRNSFSSAATSWTLCSSSSCTSTPRSNSSRSCREQRKEERDSETSLPPHNGHSTRIRTTSWHYPRNDSDYAGALISRIWPLGDSQSLLLVVMKATDWSFRVEFKVAENWNNQAQVSQIRLIETTRIRVFYYIWFIRVFFSTWQMKTRPTFLFPTQT